MNMTENLRILDNSTNNSTGNSTNSNITTLSRSEMNIIIIPVISVVISAALIRIILMCMRLRTIDKTTKKFQKQNEEYVNVVKENKDNLYEEFNNIPDNELLANIVKDFQVKDLRWILEVKDVPSWLSNNYNLCVESYVQGIYFGRDINVLENNVVNNTFPNCKSTVCTLSGKGINKSKRSWDINIGSPNGTETNSIDLELDNNVFDFYYATYKFTIKGCYNFKTGKIAFIKDSRTNLPFNFQGQILKDKTIEGTWTQMFVERYQQNNAMCTGKFKMTSTEPVNSVRNRV
jgi:hypothetical protein